MNDWRRQAAEGQLTEGTVVRFSRTFTAQDVESFGDQTRDTNPVHYNPSFCALKGFHGLICHGLLVGSMICQIGGQWAWLASDMSFRFIRPVYIGDTITCEMTLVEVKESRFARGEAVFTNQQGEVVQRAVLQGLLPSPEERQLLATMVADGS